MRRTIPEQPFHETGDGSHFADRTGVTAQYQKAKVQMMEPMSDFDQQVISDVVLDQQMILCCQCGISIPSNPANMCVNCIRSEVDITEGIPKQITVNWCKNCERWLQPPNSWTACAIESKELMALLLRKLKGLNKVRLVDASFIWTEPHSRRLKMKLTIQKEVFSKTILQQSFQVESIVASMMCTDCTRVMAQNSWKAVVQVRQKVSHKRTFYYLEQLILKHQAHHDTINIKECKDGLDFFFSTKQHAAQFVTFLQSAVPVKSQTSQQLISADIKSNTANYRTTISVDVIPICKDDLVVLPLSLAQSVGQISPLVLCTRIRGGGLTMLDFRTMQTAEIQNNVYWRSPFSALCQVGLSRTSSNLNHFFVLGVEPVDFNNTALADITVARCNSLGGATDKTNLDELDIDFENTYITRSHLGNILHEGDYALGYMISNSNFNSVLLDSLMNKMNSTGFGELPDVVLVKKAYDKKKKRRAWKVKRLADGMEIDTSDENSKSKRADQEKREDEWEGFLREIEQDREMRSMMNLYRDQHAPPEALEKRHEDDVDISELMEEMVLDDAPDS